MSYELFRMKKYIWIGIIALLPAMMAAQQTMAPVERRAVSETQWKQATDGLDYSQDVPKPEKKRKEREISNRSGDSSSLLDWNVNTKLWGSIFQVLAIIAAVALIAYGIYRMIQQPRNRLVARDGAEITLENLEAYLPETDLDRFLRDALAQQNYTLAIRLYFLQVIKDLSNAGAIHWSIEKTNRDYLREMRKHRLSVPFHQATLTFERVWYGNSPVPAVEYARIEPEFKNFLEEIRRFT